MFLNFITSFMLFVVGTCAVLVVMVLVAWVTSLLESMDASKPTAAVAPVMPPASGPASVPAPSIVPATVAEPTAAPAGAPPSGTPDIDPNVVAAITAAVTAALAGRPFRIQNIQMATGPAGAIHGATPWAQVGRLSIQSSHVIERKFR